MLDSKNALWLLSAALLPFWEEPGRFGHRVLLRVLPLVRKLGQMLLQLLAVRVLFLGQRRLKRFWRRRRILFHHRRRFRHCLWRWCQTTPPAFGGTAGCSREIRLAFLKFSRSSSSALHCRRSCFPFSNSSCRRRWTSFPCSKACAILSER